MNIDYPSYNTLGLPWGWFDIGDIAAYQKLVRQIPQKSKMVEVGVWQGRSVCSIAELIVKKHLRVHAVDTFEGTPGEAVVHNCDGKLLDIFIANINDFGLSDHVTILKGDSVKIARNFKGKVQLVFIDADHNPEKVRADIRVWLPLITTGGWISGHDYNRVKYPVEEELRRRVNHEAEIWWMQKL